MFETNLIKAELKDQIHKRWSAVINFTKDGSIISIYSCIKVNTSNLKIRSYINHDFAE